MKRFLCLMLLFALLLGLCPARAADISDVMQVYNCSEWVSLRQSPDKTSKRLAKVYLGELVNICLPASGGFVQCNYHGATGYILAQYLKTTGFTNGDDIQYNQMVVNCNEWVSLRQNADTKSARLAQVPLGAIVTGCVKMDDFIFCEYQKKQGYIPTQYLKKANYSASSQDASVLDKAAEKQYPTYQEPMEVVNCKDWVSLREKPSTSSARLAKVPLGSFVSDCAQVSDQFVYCKYRDVWGYIHVDYLKSHDPEATGSVTAFAGFTGMPSYTAFLQAGLNVLNYHAANGYTVVVQQSYGDEIEEIMAVCYNLTGQPVWQVKDTVEEVSEIAGTYAFIAGTEDEPQLVLFSVDKGFVSYRVDASKEVLWELYGEDSPSVSGGLIAAVDVEGSIYTMGYYDKAPVCISADGQLLWEAVNDNPNIYWPAKIVIEKDRIDVYYETPEEGNAAVCDVISFDKEGALLSVRQQPRENAEETL